jgi:HTH-type transcriptional regulator/antitoxin HigA
MIATDRQLARARAELTHLQQAQRAEQAEPPQDTAPELAAAALVSIQAQIDELTAEITQFEDLRAGRLGCLPLTSLLDLPKVLIAARLAAGLTQAELAEHLGVSQQQVQKDEAGDYTRANLDRLHTVAALLQVQLDGTAQLPGRGALQAIPSRDELIGGRARGGGDASARAAST